MAQTIEIKVPVLVLIILVLLGCETSKKGESPGHDFSVLGIWGYVLNDTTYGEVLFLEHYLWESHSTMGEFERDYKISKDSLIVLSPQGYAEVRLKLSVLSPDAFIATSEYATTRYSRIHTRLDLEKVTKRIDPWYSDYIADFETRYLEFEKKMSGKL